jgi:hypothetical protein
MKKFMQNITDRLADAALLEMGVDVAETSSPRYDRDSETLEENLIEVAFAEAADYDDIHEAILREHRREMDNIHPDDCQYGDSDLCFV